MAKTKSCKLCTKFIAWCKAKFVEANEAFVKLMRLAFPYDKALHSLTGAIIAWPPVHWSILLSIAIIVSVARELVSDKREWMDVVYTVGATVLFLISKQLFVWV